MRKIINKNPVTPISDPCVRFYYKFIYSNESAHKILDDSTFYKTFIKDDFESVVVPKTFEAVSKQFLIKENRKGKITPLLLDIGTYWYDNPIKKINGQFDIVGRSKEGYIFFERQYTNSKVTDQVITEEIDQINQTNLKPIQCGFFSKNGFKLNKDYPYLFYTLEDLYK